MKQTNDLFQIPSAILENHLREKTKFFNNESPFPHVVIDNFLPEALANQLESHFPNVGDPFWERFNDISHGQQRSIKLACTNPKAMPEVIRKSLEYLNSPDFLVFLTKLSGIKELSEDEKLVGGGMHVLQNGGFLGIHSDFNFHPETKLDRRLNLLLYLNKNWKRSYGGYLELWERDMTRRSKNIAPIFNRCVIFSTTSTSFHGNPIKVACPPHMARKSLALYYYTNGRPEEEKKDPHSTLYQDRPSKYRSFVRVLKKKLRLLPRPFKSA